MNIYLWNKFGHTYRILPEFDQVTHDVPRTPQGAPDPDYDDFYIPCYFGKIKHATRGDLVLYTPTVKKLTSFLKKLYSYEFNVPLENNYSQLGIIIQELLQQHIILETELLDGEGYCIFKADRLNEWREILKPRTKGVDIHPLSIKNFKTANIKLPNELEKQYQEQLNKLAPHLKEAIQVMPIINGINQRYYTEYNYNSKELCIKYGTNVKRVVAYLMGKWDEYMEYLTNAIDLWINTHSTTTGSKE